MRFLDANVFLRYLVRAATDASPELQRQMHAADRIFADIERGDQQVMTSESVLVDVVFVLTSPRLYKRPRDEAAVKLTTILNHPSVHIEHKRSHLRALELYAAHPFLDITDALSVAHMEREGIEAILSFDRDFDRVGVKREER